MSTLYQDDIYPKRPNKVYYVEVYCFDGSVYGYQAFKNGMSLGYGFKRKVIQ